MENLHLPPEAVDSMPDKRLFFAVGLSMPSNQISQGSESRTGKLMQANAAKPV